MPDSRRRVYALTIWQPWAWAIVEGYKRIENRTWKPPRSVHGKWLLIHAGARLHTPGLETVRRLTFLPQLPRLVRSHVLGAVRVGKVYGEKAEFSPERLELDYPGQMAWYGGPYAWFFDRAIAFPQPIPMHGQQGVFGVPDSVADLAREQYRLATTAVDQDPPVVEQKPNSPADVGFAGGNDGHG